jgi:hypothetical protein
MQKDDFPNRRYFTFDPDLGYPAGDTVYYECTKCGKVIASLPKDNMGCNCDNLFIDIDYGRLDVLDFDYLRVFFSE